MQAKVAVIGFDAMEATLVERWAAEGRLPTFRRLSETGTVFRPTNRVETLPSTIWVELTTGRLGGATGWYWNRWQAFAGEAQLRPAREGDADLTAVWALASDAGRRVAALDVPQAAPARDLNGVQLREWGNHETAFGFGSDPPAFGDEVLRRFGAYPGPRGDACEVHPALDDYRRLRSGLLAGIDARTALFQAVLAEQDPDLFFGVFNESHCVSHQFWGFLDRADNAGRDVPSELRTAIRDVYERLDASLARLLADIGDEATVFVVIGHGMQEATGGPQVLPEVLVRLGYGSGHGAASSVRGRLPTPVKSALKALVRGPVRRRLQAAAGSLPQPFESDRTRAISVPNGCCGGIRLNVKGREPFGAIEPGREYDEACEELAEAIGELENADTAEPAVLSVVRSDSVYGAETHPNVPDLIVRFDRNGPITAVRSKRVGTVGKPLEEHSIQRSGDHSDHSRIWALGPAVAAGRTLDEGDVLDLVPTILQLLDVPAPATLHGKPLPLGSPAMV